DPRLLELEVGRFEQGPYAPPGVRRAPRRRDQRHGHRVALEAEGPADFHGRILSTGTQQAWKLTGVIRRRVRRRAQAAHAEGGGRARAVDGHAGANVMAAAAG